LCHHVGQSSAMSRVFLEVPAVLLLRGKQILA
jgi:hypothetical protein